MKNFVLEEGNPLAGMPECLREISRMVGLCKGTANLSKAIDADIMTLRNDNEIKSLRNKLCHLHKVIVICEEYEEEGKPAVCSVIEWPQAFIEAFHLTE